MASIEQPEKESFSPGEAFEERVKNMINDLLIKYPESADILEKLRSVSKTKLRIPITNPLEFYMLEHENIKELVFIKRLN